METRLCISSFWVGRGSSVKRQWPKVPLLVWPELWLRPEHLGFGIDPLFGPATADALLANFGRNALTEASLAQASGWVLPTLIRQIVSRLPTSGNVCT